MKQSFQEKRLRIIWSFPNLSFTVLAYIDFIYSATMQLLQLNQKLFVITPFCIQKLQFISNKLCTSSTPHGQLRELAFHFSHRGSHYLKRHTRSLVELAI